MLLMLQLTSGTAVWDHMHAGSGHFTLRCGLSEHMHLAAIIVVNIKR